MSTPSSSPADPSPRDAPTEVKTLVIIPTYNEADNIGPIVTQLRRTNHGVHVLIADDNSPDGTGRIADELVAGDDHVHVLHRRRKEGLGGAYLAGFGWGLDNGFDVLVEFDADGSHRPQDLPRVLAALDDADMVKGSRWIRGGQVVNWPLSRKLLSRGGNAWTQLMLGIPLKDATGGFNAFHARTLRGIGLDDVASAGYCFQVDLAWRALREGFTVTEVPITFVERERGDSKMSRSIVIEALIRTTLWGIAHRSSQLVSAGENALDRAQQRRQQA